MAAALVASIAGGIASVPSRALVTGGIQPCAALPVPGEPEYSAGTLEVLRGDTVVETQMVSANSMYRFVLSPGDYRFEATYPNSDALSRIDFKVGAGDDIYLDAPNECI